MRYSMLFAALILSQAPLNILNVETAWAASKRGKLTCTRIRKECFKGCQKEAPREFCLGYCLDRKEECLNTGNWIGMRRTFRNVIRK